MPGRILRRPLAVQDVEEIADYLARDSLSTALRFLENTESTLVDLAKHPGVSSPFLSSHPDLADLRFRRVRGFPKHLIFFFAHGKGIEVVRILHGARDLDTELRRVR
jgi:toxin ParE1/3/4